MAAMPYFDDFDLGTVDILLISQYVLPPLLFFPPGFVWQCRRQCGMSVHMGSIDQKPGVTGKVSHTGLVSMQYLRSGQYDAFQPTCSFLEFLDNLAALLKTYCHIYS